MFPQTQDLIQPKEIKSRINQLQDFIDRECIQYLGATGETEKADEWTNRLKSFEDEISESKMLSIALLGISGAGKSTLINAILHDNVLPANSEGAACTAAVTAVQRSEDTSYTARIEFITSEDWEKELQLSLKTIEDSPSDESNSEANIPTESWVRLKKDTKDKIRAVYELQDEDLCDEIPDFRLPEGTSALLNSNEPLCLCETDSTVFRRSLQKYLTGDGNLWPLIRKVTVTGPFKNLPVGVELVDLPGVDDPNEAREQVTRDYLTRAPFIWLVFGVNRGISKSVNQLLQKQQLLRQFLFDGKLEALTMIGTNLDTVSWDEHRDNYVPLDNVSDAEVQEHWRNTNKENVRNTLRNLAFNLANNDEKNTLAPEFQSVKNTLEQTPIYFVASRDYKEKCFSADVEKSIRDATGFPKLFDRLNELSLKSSQQAHLNNLDARLESVVDEMMTFFRTSSTQHVRTTDEKQRQQTQARLEKRRKKFEELKGTHARVDEEIKQRQEKLEDHINKAKEVSVSRLEGCLKHWQKIHHGTLKAAMLRNGIWTSSSGTSYNFNEEIIEPLNENILFIWTDFFGKAMKETLQNWRREVENSLKSYLDYLEDFEEVDSPKVDIDAIVKESQKAQKATEQECDHALLNVETFIRAHQQNMRNAIKKTVQIEMSPAYEMAGKERGIGMKQRIIEHLTGRASTRILPIFETIDKDVESGMRDLLGMTQELEKLEIFAIKQGERVERIVIPPSNPSEVDQVPRAKHILSQLQQLSAS